MLSRFCRLGIEDNIHLYSALFYVFLQAEPSLRFVVFFPYFANSGRFEKSVKNIRKLLTLY